jgi:hypothetical protein
MTILAFLEQASLAEPSCNGWPDFPRQLRYSSARHRSASKPGIVRPYTTYDSSTIILRVNPRSWHTSALLTHYYSSFKLNLGVFD